MNILPAGVRAYYEDEERGIAIVHGDCREVLPLLPAGYFGLILTDPPFGVGKADWDERVDWGWIQHVPRLAGALGLIPGLKNVLACPQQIGDLCYRWMMAAHLVNGMTRGALGFGNWIPLLVYARDGVRLWRAAQDCRDFVVGTEPKPNHPCPKLVSVMQWFVASLPVGPVLDPFMGSGSTLLAARYWSRPAVGIEVDEAYCEVAARRLQQQPLPDLTPAPEPARQETMWEET